MMWPETRTLTGSLLAAVHINHGLFFLLFGSAFLHGAFIQHRFGSGTAGAAGQRS